MATVDHAEVTSGPLSRYWARLRESLGESVVDAVFAIERPAPIGDLLLAAYTPPYDAVVDGRRQPMSPEAIRFTAGRGQGQRLVGLVLEPRPDPEEAPIDRAIFHRASAGDRHLARDDG